MKKEKREAAIKELASDLDDCLVWLSTGSIDSEDAEIDTTDTAENLINAGYGKIEQVLTEFMNRLRNDERLSVPTQIFIGAIMREILKEMTKK